MRAKFLRRSLKVNLLLNSKLIKGPKRICLRIHLCSFSHITETFYEDIYLSCSAVADYPEHGGDDDQGYLHRGHGKECHNIHHQGT